MATESPRHVRKTEADWIELIEQQQRSDLPIREFCNQHKIGYSTFGKWKSRLSSLKSSESNNLVDLSDVLNQETAIRQWTLELNLGNGIHLQLSQA